jgi:hypothetical protein
VSLITTNDAGSGTAAITARAKDAAAQFIPVGKRAGATAVQGVRQGVQDAVDWAQPRFDDAVHSARDWAQPRLDDAVHSARDWAQPRFDDAVLGARGWAAPRLENAADTVTTTVAPAVSSALRSTADRVRPPETKKTGLRSLIDWRWLLVAGAVAAAAGAGAAIAMRRHYARATEEAKNATESPEDEQGPQAGDAARGSEVNGRVAAPGL